MARKPFFSGNYGSALARVDTRPIMEAGRAQGQMYANMGQQIGGMIKQYGLNKEKQGKITDKIENRLKLDPSIAQRLTMSGDEDYDKKNAIDMEKLASGELGLKGLQRLDSAMATINEVDLQKQAEEDREMKKSAFKLSQLTQQLSNDNTRLRKDIAELTKDDVVAQSNAKTRIDKSKADITETTASYLPDQITTDLRSKNASTEATLQRVDQGAELFPLVKQYKEGQIEYQDLLKKRLLINSTEGLSTDNTKTYQDVTKQIDDIMNDFGTVKDGEALKIEDMIEDITDSGEIILREDISVQAQGSIPRLQDLLKKKYELDRSRVLENVPMKDGSRRDMTQSQFDLMMKDDREKQQQSNLLKQAQMQAGSGYNVQPPTMFK